jgi:hypothetical protein
MKKRNAVLVGALVIVAAGLGWAFWPSGPDPQVARVVELQEKLFGGNLPQADRRKAFEELRQEVEKLTPEQREKLMRDNPPPFARQMQKNIVAYFDLPADQRRAALDKQIDEMERMRKEFEKRRGERGGPHGARRGPPGGFGGNMSAAQRNEMRKRMLDNTSPQQRAMFDEYFRDLAQRRKERGLPPLPGPRR